MSARVAVPAFFALAILGTGCAGIGGSSADDVEIVDAKSDDGSPVSRVELGGRYVLDVRAGEYGGLWLVLGDGETAALIVSGADGFDPYVVAKTREALLASRDQQALLPQLPPSDVAFVIDGPAQVGLVIAGGPSFDTGGIATVDVVALEDSPAAAFDSVGPGQRSLHDRLRQLESDRARFAGTGALSERTDGYVEVDLAQAALSERQQLNATAARINELRGAYFELADPDQPELAGSQFATITEALVDRR